MDEDIDPNIHDITPDEFDDEVVKSSDPYQDTWAIIEPC